MRTLSSSAFWCQNICSTRIVGRSAVMHGRYCSFFTRNKSFSRNLHRVCIIGKVPRRQFLRESRIENRVEYRDSILDSRENRESSVNLHLGGTVFLWPPVLYLYQKAASHSIFVCAERIHNN